MKLFKAVIVLKDCIHVRHRLKTVPVHQIKVTLIGSDTSKYFWLRELDNPELKWRAERLIIISRSFDIILIKEIPSEST